MNKAVFSAWNLPILPGVPGLTGMLRGSGLYFRQFMDNGVGIDGNDEFKSKKRII